MAHIIASRVGEQTTTVGTGTYTVSGAINAGYRAFSTVMLTGDHFYGVVEAVDANGVPTGDWEEGLYTKTGSTTFERTEIHASSNSNEAVSWAAGTKRIYMSFTARLARSLISGSSSGEGADDPTAANARPYGIDDSPYGDLAFTDEFNAATLDTTKWNTTVWYEAEPDTVNYALQNGDLCIYPMLNGDGNYFNRSIDTDGKYYALYGYFEVRAKLPIGYGAWPAIWLFNHIGDDRPEIDIMEAYCGGENAGNGGWSDTNDHPRSYAATLHSGIDGPGTVVYSINNVAAGFPFMDLSADYHYYGVHVDATGVQFYFDGVAIGVRTETTLYQREMYLMLDLWFGSASGDPNNPPAGVDPAPTGIANSFRVDYFRHWPLA